MPWTVDGPAAGFTPSDDPWLPVPDAHRRLAVALQENDPDSVLAAWRVFLALRRRPPALRHGEIEIIETPQPVLAFRRWTEGECLVAVLNLGAEAMVINAPGLISLKPLEDFDFPFQLERDGIRLEPYGFVIGFV
jgi:alpha-glucosidase